MKIAWFTPFSKKSAIAKVSELIVKDLSQTATVDLWCADTGDLRNTGVRTVQFSRGAELDLSRLAEYDAVVYNFGNYLPFHREIFEVSRRYPGICVMHDFVMHHFFAAYYLEELRSREAYAIAMRRLYGREGEQVAKEHRIWETDEVTRFPFFEDAIRGAYGVVAHSEFFLERVRESYAGPVIHLALPYDIQSPGTIMSRRELGVPEDHVLIVTIGHVNPNKRIDRAMEALAACNSKVTYAVLGPYDSAYRDRLLSLAKTLGVTDCLHLPGFVSDETLQSYLTHADICLNLRYPATEGASASAIEEMLYGKPLVVTDTGFYHELPGDCVRKISIERESAELRAVLRELIDDGELRRELGARGKAFASATFRSDRYATGFMTFVQEVLGAKPLLQLADRMALEMGQMGMTAKMEIVDSVSGELHDLFCDGEVSGTDRNV